MDNRCKQGMLIAPSIIAGITSISTNPCEWWIFLWARGKEERNTEMDREVKLLFCDRPSQKFCKLKEVPLRSFGKNEPSGSDGNISCSNLKIKTLQRAFWQCFGDGISDCSGAEVLFYRINFCPIFERMVYSQTNASFPMSCCSPMLRRSLLRSSLPKYRNPLSISFIQHWFKTKY